jgi:anti-sigma factor RsiW
VLQRPYITCRQLIEFIADYLSNELPADQRAESERHLGVCPACVAYLQNYQATLSLEKAAFQDLDAAAPAELPEDLLRSILAARPQP